MSIRKLNLLLALEVYDPEKSDAFNYAYLRLHRPDMPQIPGEGILKFWNKKIKWTRFDLDVDFSKVHFYGGIPQFAVCVVWGGWEVKKGKQITITQWNGAPVPTEITEDWLEEVNDGKPNYENFQIIPFSIFADPPLRSDTAYTINTAGTATIML